MIWSVQDKFYRHPKHDNELQHQVLVLVGHFLFKSYNLFVIDYLIDLYVKSVFEHLFFFRF